MPKLVGEKVVLREWRVEDIEELTWVTNAEITDCLSDNFLFPLTAEQTKQRAMTFLNGTANEKEFIIAKKEDNKYLGQISFIGFDQKNQLARMGIVIGDKNNHGKGYGTEAIELLLKFAFTHLNLLRVELDVVDFNIDAQQLYEKLGFVVEGRRRECYFVRGEFHDKIQMAILKREWLELQDKIY